MHNLSIDLETFSSEPIAKTGLYKYVQSRDFQILLFAYSLDGAPVRVLDLTREALPEWLKAALFDPDYIKHAFNAAFEWYLCNAGHYDEGGKHDGRQDTGGQQLGKGRLGLGQGTGSSGRHAPQGSGDTRRVGGSAAQDE